MLFGLLDCGSVVIVYGLDGAARQWLDDNVEPTLVYAHGIVVEPRYLPQLIEGIHQAGGTFEGEDKR